MMRCDVDSDAGNGWECLAAPEVLLEILPETLFAALLV